MTQWGLDTLFNPAKRHMDEEKRRLQSTREEVGDASGGKRIDLESGKVTIQRGAKDEDATDEVTDEVTDGGTGEPGEAGAEKTDTADLDQARPETAADRARARRARQRAQARAADDSAADNTATATATDATDDTTDATD